MRSRLFSVLFCVAVVVGLAGCSSGQGGSVTTTPVAPSPSLPSSPSMSPTPDMDALYAEAERVWLRSLELRSSYELRGDFSEFPSELEELLADPHLTNMRGVFEHFKQEGWRAPEGASPLVTTRHLPGVSREGSLVALETCLDTRPVPVVDVNGTVVSEGRIIRAYLFFKHEDAQLRLFIADSQSEVEACQF